MSQDKLSQEVMSEIIRSTSNEKNKEYKSNDN